MSHDLLNMQQLPTCFCWTRFGTEAGQTIDSILARKERERIENNGLFLWGIGNAIGPSIRELVRCNPSPDVLFSSIISKPRSVDVSPGNIAIWTTAKSLDGENFQIPIHSVVSSRYDPSKPRVSHYALVCCRDSELRIDTGLPKLMLDAVRNILTGEQVGASQTTAVVKVQEGHCGSARTYKIAFHAKLVMPYLIRLETPILVKAEGADWSLALQEFVKNRQKTN